MRDLFPGYVSMIFYRPAFFTLEPGEFTAPHRINMGVLAIAILAGASLILNAADRRSVQ